jgi:chromosome partitioning protein
MIILSGGEKGGTGKTTLATNLAVYRAHRGRDVLLLDVDEQGSSSRWANIRTATQQNPRIACMAKHGIVADAVRDVAKRYDDIVIDAGGGETQELRSALLVADVFVVPVRPSLLDLWTSENLEEVVTLARGFNPGLRLVLAISQAPTHHKVTETAEAEELLKTFASFELARTVLHMRKTYRDAIVEGRGVQEMPNDKARTELEALAVELFTAP